MEPTRIIVRTPNWVGDAVLSLPFFASLRMNAPNAEIVALTRPHLSSLFGQSGSVDRVLTLGGSSRQTEIGPIWKTAVLLRTTRFDLGFCLPPSFGSALIFFLGRVRRRIGHDFDARRWLLTDAVPYGPNGQRPHRTDGYLALLTRVWTAPTCVRIAQFTPDDATQKLVDAAWTKAALSATRPILALAPGAAQPNKLWAASRFAEIASRWVNQTEGQVLLIGGSGDATACSNVADLGPPDRLVNMAAAGDLPFVAELIRRSRLFIGNDSGLAHLAAAVGTPTVVISGPGDPSEVAPLAPHTLTVKKSVFCSPCYKNTCYRSDHPLECQDLVTVDDVWGAANTLLQRHPEDRTISETQRENPRNRSVVNQTAGDV